VNINTFLQSGGGSTNTVNSVSVWKNVFGELRERGLGGTREIKDIANCLSTTLTEINNSIKDDFFHRNDGLACAQSRSDSIDCLLIGLFDLAVDVLYPMPNPTRGETLQILAIGGYGRGRLAPYSDIDVLFLLPYKRTPRAEQIVEFILYTLWDLGLKVGHAVRSVEECGRLAQTDMVIRTSLLDLRPLAGEPTLGDDLKTRLQNEVYPNSSNTYVAAKQEERRKRLEREGDSRYRLEPNVKDGKGGLRDLQLLLWISAHVWSITEPRELARRGIFLAAEQRLFERAEAFFWAVRCHLHYQAGRAEERLTFDVQPTIAERLGYTGRTGALAVERFMKHYFLTAYQVGELQRIILNRLDSGKTEWRLIPFPNRSEGFPLTQGKLSLPDDKYFTRHPLDLIRIFRASQKSGRAIHVHTQNVIYRSRTLVSAALRADVDANALFLEIIEGNNADEILRAMNEAGILGRFLPDWGRIVGQMQYDMYHVYTVDEHTLHVLTNFMKLRTGKMEKEFPLASRLARRLSTQRTLFLTLLLHDIAKGRGGDHSILGAKVAAAFCARLGLPEAESETISWLVRWHLAMSDTAFKRDLGDPETIANFAAFVQSPERLRLLLILTTCDIHAVGPGRWNNWKAGLLNELYNLTSAYLSGTPIGKTEVEILDGSAKNPFIAIARKPERSIAEVKVYAHNTPALFSELAGGLSASGFSIAEAKISTLSNGMALYVFCIGVDEHVTDEELELLRDTLAKSMNGQICIVDDLTRYGKQVSRRSAALPAPIRVLINNDESETHTLIEINGRDRAGLLYALAVVFAGMNVQISSAKIATYGHRIVDVFYVRDMFEHKITDETFLSSMYGSLKHVLNEDRQNNAAAG
jgi:[protein-PII] uridylyltransferase